MSQEWYEGEDHYYEEPGGFAEESPDNDFSGIEIYDGNDQLIAISVINPESRLQAYERAQLIIVAPELLEACKALMTVVGGLIVVDGKFQSIGPANPHVIEFMVKAREAVAKAGAR